MYLLSGCASTKLDPPSPFDAARQLLTTDIYQSDPDNFIQELYDSRGWVPYKTLENDPVDLGVSLETPIQDARMKLVGPSREDALRSLALKIW
ncbi:MAG: hypothetical protein GWN30_22910, partial [Gammaproteobacteria bacterium]|nr:hypothetical protein [Gammaproteobacteria bacterium]